MHYFNCGVKWSVRQMLEVLKNLGATHYEIDHKEVHKLSHKLGRTPKALLQMRVKLLRYRAFPKEYLNPDKRIIEACKKYNEALDKAIKVEEINTQMKDNIKEKQERYNTSSSSEQQDIFITWYCLKTLSNNFKQLCCPANYTHIEKEEYINAFLAKKNINKSTSKNVNVWLARKGSIREVTVTEQILKVSL